MEQQINPEHPKGNDSINATRTMDASKPKKPKKGIKLFAIAVVVAVVALAGYLAFSAVINGNFAGNSLKNKKVFDKAVASYNAFPGIAKLSEADRAELKKTLEPQYLAGYVTGFGPNDAETKSAIYTIGDSAAATTIKNYIENIISSKTQLAKTTGYYQGYLLYFWFGNTVVNKYPTEQIKDWGNPEVLAADRQYADTKAKDYQKRLLAGSIKPQQVADELMRDPRLKLNDQTNGSGYFTTQSPLSSGNANINDFAKEIAKLFKPNDTGRAASINKVLESISEPGVSEIGLITSDEGQPPSGVKKDVGFVVAAIEVVLKGQKSIDSYQTQLEIAKAHLK
ncbi:MAG: hypothetical protein WCN86_03610 [bacterium]